MSHPSMIITTMLGIMYLTTLSFYCQTLFMQRSLHIIMLKVIFHLTLVILFIHLVIWTTLSKYYSLGKLNSI